MKVLHLIDALDCNGAARQIHLLGRALGTDGVAVEVCCLGPTTSWADSLRHRGVTVHALNWTRWFDPSVLWNLRDLLRRSSPDVIHVWRLPALRALAVVARNLLPRVVMSAPLPARGRPAWWDRRLLQQVRCLAVAGVSDQEHCLRQGLVAPVLRVVPPAAGDHAGDGSRRTARSILCVGNLERNQGFRYAIWAFDILRLVHGELRLGLAGAGSELPNLQALTIGLENRSQIDFLGERADISPLLQAAEIVWIPSIANCGRQVALEAMAQGCTVVASDVPCLRDVIVDGETGILTPPGDVAQLARITHRLFGDALLRERLGQAARLHAARRYSVAEAALNWRGLYRSVAA